MKKLFINAAFLVGTSVSMAAAPFLTNHEGLTLYTYDPDTAGASTCYNGCAKAWPADLETTGPLEAGFGVTTRTDNTIQLTYKNKPLYTYIGDSGPGDTTGDGIGGVWHLAKP